MVTDSQNFVRKEELFYFARGILSHGSIVSTETNSVKIDLVGHLLGNTRLKKKLLAANGMHSSSNPC